jgi:branched-chain amino acid transport system ATP-binding protein
MFWRHIWGRVVKMKNNNREEKKNPVLDIEDLFVSYGKIKALHGVSFQVYDGEIVSMLGSNGAGKTTTLNAISGVIPTQSGKINFKGESLVGVKAHTIVKKGIVHVPEGRHIFPELTVEENLRIAGYLFSRLEENKLLSERKEYVFSLFPRLKERARQMGGTLSGGEQQMLAISRAIVTGGEVLLLDEPSMGIAPRLVEEIFETIMTISKSGKTILLVEQNAMMAMEIADYCYVLETGSIAFEGVSKTLMENDTIAKAYLGESF